MRWAWWITTFGLVAGGCAPANQERVADFNQDGVYLFQRGDYRAARESFEAALNLRPNDLGLLFNIGQCYDHLGNAAEAERFYLECLQRDPNMEAARHALAALLVRQGRMADAQRMIEAWITADPRLATAYAEYAWLQLQTGDLPRSRDLLMQALALNPRDIRALTELGQVFEAMHRPDRALVCYERALEVNPHQPALAARVNDLIRQGVQPPKPDL